MMDIGIYQIEKEKDLNGVMFRPFGDLARLQGSPFADAGIYARTFEGRVDADDLEQVYMLFNGDVPEGFSGRSMSVSDVVAVRKPDGPEYWYCDPRGFTRTEFDEARAGEAVKETITVVMCEPGRKARVARIGTDLVDLQRAVGGLIETYYPFGEEVCIVCNDEGKCNGMRPCRAICGDDGRLRDIVFGPFFICGCAGTEFGSLTPEQTERYSRMFMMPEHYYRINGEFRAVPYDPAREEEYVR